MSPSLTEETKARRDDTSLKQATTIPSWKLLKENIMQTSDLTTDSGDGNEDDW